MLPARCSGSWRLLAAGGFRGHPRTTLRGVQGSNPNTRNSRAGHPLAQAACYPLGEVLSSGHPSWAACSAFPSSVELLARAGVSGRLFHPGHGIFLPVRPTSTSYSRATEQLGSASNSRESLNYLLLRFMRCNRINHEDLQGLPSIISLQEGAEGPWCRFIPSAACLEANIQHLTTF